MPSLVNRWKADLNMLELIDVSCRVMVEEGKYSERPFSRNFRGVVTTTNIYPLVFGCKCDCGAVHFHVDGEGAAAKCLGFLEEGEEAV